MAVPTKKSQCFLCPHVLYATMVNSAGNMYSVVNMGIFLLNFIYLFIYCFFLRDNKYILVASFVKIAVQLRFIVVYNTTIYHTLCRVHNHNRKRNKTTYNTAMSMITTKMVHRVWPKCTWYFSKCLRNCPIVIILNPKHRFCFDLNDKRACFLITLRRYTWTQDIQNEKICFGHWTLRPNARSGHTHHR